MGPKIGSFLFGIIMATEIITSFDQQCDANGDPISGAKINVYAVNTTTPLSLFSDTGLSIGAANPIVCDSAGRHDMRYVATGSYKILVTTSADVPVYTRDNIDGRVPVGSGALAIANGGTGATSAGAALSNLGGATAAELADLAADVAALSGDLASSEKTHIATGTTAQRPAIPVEGDIRRNTTSVAQWEGYNGTGWDRFATPVATFTKQYLLSGTGATYTLPTGCKTIVVKMVGGGGGGGAQGTNSGTVGNDTTFNSIVATGGGAGIHGGSTCLGGAGGTGGAGSASMRIPGSAGASGHTNTGTAIALAGGSGGSSFFGGNGRGGVNSDGTAATTNSGSGGGGGGGTGSAGAGGGGGSGEFVEILITSPSSSYTYTVGGTAAGGSAGTRAGGAGAAGIIVVEEYYR
jgi:hypothetical protein